MDSVLDVVRKECEHCDCLQVKLTGFYSEKHLRGGAKMGGRS